MFYLLVVVLIYAYISFSFCLHAVLFMLFSVCPMCYLFSYWQCFVTIFLGQSNLGVNGSWLGDAEWRLLHVFLCLICVHPDCSFVFIVNSTAEYCAYFAFNIVYLLY